jgi:hypothetical protein
MVGGGESMLNRGWTKARALMAATAMALVTAGASPVLARTNHAVLVAVTEYPNLPQKNWLVGPNHDAVLVRDYLQTSAPALFDKANVALLADGVEGATASPTRENILAALKGVADKAATGDFVYIHLSGHGAQEPEKKAGTETDGMDEIFLPRDISRWNKATNSVPNALVDDDIGGALDAIRNKGAFVWVIFDACHSGSATRAAPINDVLEVSRKLDSDDLGISDVAVKAAAAGAKSGDDQRQAAFSLTDESTEGADASRAVQLSTETANPSSAISIAKGGMVAFFAAQTIETTPEMPLPKGEEGATRYGLFTYTIMSKLAENPRMTYRQLGRAVLQQYAADTRERPTPLFEGDLDAPVFGTESGENALEWPLTVKDGEATLPAGKLHRLAVGTKLAIMPPKGTDLADAIGYVEVKSAKNLTSRVVAVAFKDKPALNLADLPPKTYARLAEVTIDFKLKVARPAPTEGLDAEVALANQTLDALVADPKKKFNVELVNPGEEADVRLAVLREQDVPGAVAATAGVSADAGNGAALFFLSSTGELSLENGRRPPLVAIDTANGEKLQKGTRANLETIFRATSLSRLAAASAASTNSVTVSFKIKRAETGEFEVLDGSTVPIVHPDDEVHIQAENVSDKLFDINILYVGSDYSITHIDAQRLAAKAKVDEGLLAFTDSSFGIERMVAVITEAPPLSEVEDLSFLAQGGVPPATRAVGEPGAFSNILSDIGLAPSTRSAMKLGDKGGQEGQVLIFSLETEPKS